MLRLLEVSALVFLVMKKRSPMFSTLLICATSVLLGISEISGKIRSKPMNFFLSETKQKNPDKTHIKKEKNSELQQTPKPKILSPTQKNKTKMPPKPGKSHLFSDHLTPKVLSSKTNIFFLTAAITYTLIHPSLFEGNLLTAT